MVDGIERFEGGITPEDAVRSALNAVWAELQIGGGATDG